MYPSIEERSLQERRKNSRLEANTMPDNTIYTRANKTPYSEDLWVKTRILHNAPQTVTKCNRLAQKKTVTICDRLDELFAYSTTNPAMPPLCVCRLRSSSQRQSTSPCKGFCGAGRSPTGTSEDRCRLKPHTLPHPLRNCPHYFP